MYCSAPLATVASTRAIHTVKVPASIIGHAGRSWCQVVGPAGLLDDGLVVPQAQAPAAQPAGDLRQAGLKTCRRSPAWSARR